MTGQPISPAAAHAMPAAEVAAALGTDLGTGLASTAAAERLARHGPNELPSTPPVPAWRRFLAQFADPMVYLLLGAIVISFAAWMLEGAHGLPVDAIVIAVVLLLNATIGFVQENEAADAVASLSEMTRAQATVLRDGGQVQLDVSDLVVGDVLVLAEGDQIGADARLAQAASLRVVESSLTGEADTVVKSIEPVAAEAQLADRRSNVYRGTSVARGTGRAVVFATGADTEMGEIARMLDEVEDDPTPLQREIAQISTVLGVLVVAIAVVVVTTLILLSPERTSQTFIDALLLGVSLAVAAVPEGMPAILSVVLALGVQRMARHRAVVKNLTSVETLGSASVICSDKTGTLTRSEMTIQEVATASGTSVVTGIGYEPTGIVAPDLDHDGRPDVDALEGALGTEVAVVLRGGALASDAQLSHDDDAWTVIGDPTEGAFLVAERKLEGEGLADTVERVGEVPFTSERKLMSVLYTALDGRQSVLVSKGAPDVLMERCTHLRVDGEPTPLDDSLRERFGGHVQEMSGRALRTLAVAYREVPQQAVPAPGEPGQGDDTGLEELEHGLTLAGVVGIIDPPRPEAAEAIAEAHRAGIRVLMITGDHPATASRIAADLGIVEAGAPALIGAELSRLDDEELREAVRTTSVFARVAPEHKLRIVAALKDQDHIVAMTGDGVNDAPALRAADIGVAMGVTGTQVTKDAASMVLADDNFATIVAAVREGRRILDNIRKFLRYLLSSNMGEVLTVFGGVVLAGWIGLQGEPGSGVVLPLVATQILWINLVTDSGPALAMGVDPSVEDVMARTPRRPDERVVDRQMWSGIVLIGLVMAVVTLATIDIFLPGGMIEGEDSLDVARTAGFTTLVFCQLFNTLNSRSESVSAFSHLFTNRWLWAALGLGVALQVAVVHVPFMQTAFSTASLDLRHWLICIALASCVLWVDEVRKIIRRRR